MTLHVHSLGYELALLRQRAIREGDRAAVRAIDAEFERREAAKQPRPERVVLERPAERG